MTRRTRTSTCGRVASTDAALAVRALRAEGKSVLLHCVHAQTRTPVVPAAYGAPVTGTSELEALRRVQQVLPSWGLAAGLDR